MQFKAKSQRFVLVFTKTILGKLDSFFPAMQSYSFSEKLKNNNNKNMSALNMSLLITQELQDNFANCTFSSIKVKMDSFLFIYFTIKFQIDAVH